MRTMGGERRKSIGFHLSPCPIDSSLCLWSLSAVAHLQTLSATRVQGFPLSIFLSTVEQLFFGSFSFQFTYKKDSDFIQNSGIRSPGRDHQYLDECYDNLKSASSIDDKIKWLNISTWSLARHAISVKLTVYPFMEKWLGKKAELSPKKTSPSTKP